MFNVLLDPLPTEYEGFPIDTDFQTGIQIMQVLEDGELSQQEQIGTALSLLFLVEDSEGNPLDLPDYQTAIDGLMWYLSAWNHDHGDKDKHDKIMDFDVDQWRIYADFRRYYNINVNTEQLHYWEFMALLSALPNDGAYKNVLFIRDKKLDSKMSKEERNTYIKLKEIYALKQTKAAEYTDEQKEKIDEYDRMMEEIKKEAESKKLAEAAFKDMVKEV